MDENVAKFSEKMKELLALAKKKKNVLEYQEISDFFSDMELDAEQMDKDSGISGGTTMLMCFGLRTMGMIELDDDHASIV